ncbi:ATP-binding protein [Butyricimonas hominis]|uniref:AAA family ATPase n=1 Tax=Butyricimonas TaxID=574697 RepID=UPI00351316D3
MAKEFIFGVAVSGENFIGREKEIHCLSSNFKNGINTILSSPRRWGKTSLIKKVKAIVESDKLRVIYVDIFPCRSEYDFYNMFAEAVLKQTSFRFDEWKDIAYEFISRLTPKFAFSVGPDSDYSVSLGITSKTHSAEEVLQLPERIAQKKGIQIVICIDEFQQIGEFPDSVIVQKKMRSAWQHNSRVSYCLLGSRKHLMDELFQKRSLPFYKFGDIINLKLIPTEVWVPYICKQFKKVDRVISEELAAEICRIVENHSSYVQQLAWLTLLETEKVATREGVARALNELLDENTPLFTQQTELLTTYQMNFLRAILAGIHKEFGIATVLSEYNLGSSSNISRLRKSMVEKELVEFRQEGYFIADPILKIWLERQKW